jgi:hypothetical protein
MCLVLAHHRHQARFRGVILKFLKGDPFNAEKVIILELDREPRVTGATRRRLDAVAKDAIVIF